MLRAASVQEFQSWSHKSMKMESGAASVACNALEAFLEAGPHGVGTAANTGRVKQMAVKSE